MTTVYCPLCKTEADKKDGTNDYECTVPECELRYFTLYTIKDKGGYYPKREVTRSNSTVMFGGGGDKP